MDKVERARQRIEYGAMTPVLYWAENNESAIADIPELRRHARDYVDVGVPAERRRRVVEILRDGPKIEWWRGYADCRLCGERLGTSCRGAWGFRWPDKSWHYLEHHGVWVPELDDLLAKASGKMTLEELREKRLGR